jgi:glycopeptide antibiotics resistance protein
MRIRVSIIIILLAMFFISMVTLYPFAFNFRNSGGLRDLLIVGTGRSDEKDFLGNILLFIPLGIGLGRLLIGEMHRNWMTSLGISGLVSFGFSYVIEALQIHMPSRFASILDVIADTTGGMLGLMFFLFWYREVRSATAARFVKKHLLLLSLVYIGMVFPVTSNFAFDRSFNNWGKDYALVFGNEATGTRPWKGCISEAYIANRALTEKEVSMLHSRKMSVDSIGSALLVYYRFAGNGIYHGHFGHLPALISRGTAQDTGQENVVCLGPGQWIETAQPPVFLTERISAASELTVGVTVMTDRINQTGPARIISLSADTHRRNFTLGQQGRDLQVRIRTPLTELNGTQPQLVIHDVFSRDRRVELVVTYNRSVLSVYVDGVLSSQSLRLSPDGVSFRDSIRGKEFNLVRHKLYYYAMIFLPLGILIAFVTKTTRNAFSPGIAVTILFSSMLEGILSEVGGRNIHIENIVLSVGITAIALFFVNMCMKLAESRKQELQ